MAAIDRDELLVDVNLRIPDDNVFSDAQMLVFIERVITAVGDDDSDENYAEVLCKSLKSIATNNKAKSTTSGGLRSRKIEDVIEESYFKDGSKESWQRYLDDLDDLCADLGYTGLSQYSTGFMYISSGDTITVNDTSSVDTSSVLTNPL